MTLPLPTPEVDVIPFFIDWSASEAHPAQGLPGQLELKSLTLSHPEAERMQQIFSETGLPNEVLTGAAIAIRVSLQTPAGIVEL